MLRVHKVAPLSSAPLGSALCSAPLRSAPLRSALLSSPLRSAPLGSASTGERRQVLSWSFILLGLPALTIGKVLADKWTALFIFVIYIIYVCIYIYIYIYI